MRQKSLNDKIESKSEKQARSMADSTISHKPKPKARVQREKAVIKEQIKQLGGVKPNEIKKDEKDNESSQMSSRINGRVKISIKSSREYYEKVNPNGFSRCPPPFTQLLPPIIIISFIAEITITTQHYLPSYQSYIIWSVMGFLILPIVYFWYITTAISPTDSIQLQHLGSIQNPSRSNFEPEKHKYFCNLCKTCISQKSFHCNKCHRCVEYFDHHCKWLNNCIGAKNYVEFIRLVVLSELFMVFFYVVNVIVMIQICNQEQKFSVLFWIAVGTVAFSIVPFIAISMLLCLHVYLIIAKRATIDLILQNRKKNKINPQNTSDHLTEKRQAQYQVTPIPEQSPMTSPCFFQKQHSILRQLSVNGTGHESLKKFVTNLANNLKISKKESKDHQQTNNSFIDNKINFKPTILKKSTSFGCVEFKTNTLIEKNNKKPLIEQNKQAKKPRSNKNDDSINESELQEEQRDTGKNLITKLRFSTKNEILDESNDEKTEKEFNREEIKSQTERPEYDKRKNNPKRLEPLAKNHTQRRIKFTAKIETFDNKQNVDRLKDLAHLDFDNLKLEQNDEFKVQNNEANNELKDRAKTTRVFKIKSQNKEQLNDDEEN